MTHRYFSFHQLRRLNRDSAPHLFNCALTLVLSSLQTNLTRVLAGWWGVQLGPRCCFYGIPLFRRLPGSAIQVGEGCQFRSSPTSNLVGVNRRCILATLAETATIRVGKDCGFSGTVVSAAANISIGDRVLCGANVTITDTDWHPLDWRDRLAGKPGNNAPVVIGDDVWLGMNVVVLKGVQIGPRTVVGAGSIVTQSLPPGVIAAGQPAKVVRTLPSDETSAAPLRTMLEDQVFQ